MLHYKIHGEIVSFLLGAKLGGKLKKVWVGAAIVCPLRKWFWVQIPRRPYNGRRAPYTQQNAPGKSTRAVRHPEIKHTTTYWIWYVKSKDCSQLIKIAIFQLRIFYSFPITDVFYSNYLLILMLKDLILWYILLRSLCWHFFGFSIPWDDDAFFSP